MYSRSLASAKSLATDLGEEVELYSEDQEGRGYEELLRRGDIVGVVIAYVHPHPHFVLCYLYLHVHLQPGIYINVQDAD